MDLSITNLEMERQRRQIDLIAHLARTGGELPKPEFSIDRRGTNISLGPVNVTLDATELGGDPKHLVVRVSNKEVETKLYALFHDTTVTKRLYDHIFEALEVEMSKDDGTIRRYGETKFCG